MMLKFLNKSGAINTIIEKVSDGVIAKMNMNEEKRNREFTYQLKELEFYKSNYENDLKDIFDFSAITTSLTNNIGVTKDNFIYVSLYISFVNSLLEEFFFRGFSFITLKEYTSRKFAYIFSSLAFALYHIAMMIGWFDVPVILISLAGLFAGGMIFNRFDEKNENIYLSWLIHMFANFATNTIGFILFAA